MAITGYGAFAEEVKTEARRMLPIPAGDGLRDRRGVRADLRDVGARARAIAARLKAGETLLVLGAAGGVGLAAIEIGKVLGARVIACASTDDKLAVCREHGADETINYATEDLRERIKALTGGAGADVVYDPVGGAYTELALRSIAWRGRLLVVGFAAGEIPKIPLNLTLLKGCSIVGVFWGDFTRREPQHFAEAMARLGQLVRRRQAQAAHLGDVSARARRRRADADGRAKGDGQSRAHGRVMKAAVTRTCFTAAAQVRRGLRAPERRCAGST